MFKRIQPCIFDTKAEVRDVPWNAWLEIYLNEISENRRAVNARILDRIPRPRAFFGGFRDGQIISTAACVIAHGCAVVECVTTRADARRQGAAVEVLTTLESWAAQQGAETIGLQVVATNVAAVTLYQRLGFIAGATNRFFLET
jgi:ribosomal protein S18 acetylase RimI-like enzyme